MNEIFKKFNELKKIMNGQIIGQETLVLRLLTAVLADGHLLVEGAPGLAKTTAIKVLAECIESEFHRVQFTPDLLPADLTGTEIYRPQDGTFVFQKGPLFHNLLLADEINRAPAKVQSALLEAMGERQITVSKHTYPLPQLFLVMATQNPIDQEGTYPLPEAQMDRFLMQVNIDYPDVIAEQKILTLVRERSKLELENNGKAVSSTSMMLSQSDLFEARKQILALYMAPDLEKYLVELVMNTRKDTGTILRFGASPRATIGLDRCARVNAWLNERDYVSPEDIQSIASDVLRHRIILSFEAEAEGLTAEKYIHDLLAKTPVP
jgi:MoxR-like ATPase